MARLVITASWRTGTMTLDRTMCQISSILVRDGVSDNRERKWKEWERSASSGLSSHGVMGKEMMVLPLRRSCILLSTLSLERERQGFVGGRDFSLDWALACSAPSLLY